MATAVTPQQGWKIVGEFYDDIDDVQCWVISNSGSTTGYFVDVSSTAYYTNLTVSGMTINNYYLVNSYWRGFSNPSFRVDGDWYILWSGSGTANATLTVFDYNDIVDVTMRSNYSQSSAYTEFNMTMPALLSRSTIPISGNTWYQIGYLSSVLSLAPSTTAGYVTRGIQSCDINDLCITATGPNTSTAPRNYNAHIQITLACPKVKLPSDIQIGDDFPGANVTVNVTTNDVEAAWRNALTNIFPQSGSSAVGIAANVNKELANNANTGAVGSFEISEQQIDTIAGWFHNSFVFQWFSMFVLMFVLLFFIKKGMA